MACAADAARSLPGDDLIADASAVMDRVLHLPAPPEQVWPWLVQLGKRRAGWYFPRNVERVIPRRRRASTTIQPRWQATAVGDRVPDWGPGDPSFEAVTVDPPHALVYSSLRQRSRGHAWPDPGHEDDADVMAFSWALVLSPADDPTDSPAEAQTQADGRGDGPADGYAGDGRGTRLQIRLRIRRSGRPPRPWTPLLMAAGRLVDWATIALLERGLTERLLSPRPGARPGR